MERPKQLTVYRSCTPVVDAEYRPEEDRSPAEAVVNALAEATGSDRLELPPLYEFVDPEALDQLFTQHNSTVNADALLGFTMETWNVFVREDGRIRVCDATQPTDPEPVFDAPTA